MELLGLIQIYTHNLWLSSKFSLGIELIILYQQSKQECKKGRLFVSQTKKLLLLSSQVARKNGRSRVEEQKRGSKLNTWRTGFTFFRG